MRTILSTLIKSLILLSLIVILPMSCSKNNLDNDDFKYKIPEGNRELYDQITNELYDYLYTHENATIEDIQEQLNKYSSQVTSEVKDDILYLKIDSVYDFICDPYRKTCLHDKETNSVNELDVSSLINEIESSLYPEGENGKNTMVGTKTIDYIPSQTKSRALLDISDMFLTKKKIMIWDPWKISNMEAGIYSRLFDDKLEIDFYNGISAKLDRIKDFCNYDVVYMCCHGTPKGLIVIPDSFFDWFNVYMGKGQKIDKGLVIDENKLVSLFGGQDLSKTVVWTAICWGGSGESVLRKIVKDHKAAAFAGCDSESLSSIPKCPFNSFLISLYGSELRSSVKDAAINSIPLECFPEMTTDDAHYSDEDRDPIKMLYHDFYKPDPRDRSITINVSGNFIFECGPSPVYSKPLVLPSLPIDGDPSADITTSDDLFYPLFDDNNSNTRSSSGKNWSVGFWIKNKETGESKEIEFKKSTVKVYKLHSYKKICNRVVLLGRTDSLGVGTYEYRTYLEIDGEKEYSDSTYVFTVKEGSSCPDNNHPHAIDLGLPSGNKWSCCDYVYYFKDDNNVIYNQHDTFGWGSTSTLGLYEYGWAIMDNLTGSYLFNNKKPYTYIGDEISCTDHDVVYINWKDGWCTPTAKDYEELMSNCKLSFEIDPETNSLYAKYVGPNRNYIKRLLLGGNSDTEKYYWSGTLNNEAIDDDYPDARLFAYCYKLKYKKKEEKISHSLIGDLRQTQHKIWPVQKK